MQITEKKLENAIIELEISVPVDRVEIEYKSIFEQMRKTAKIDGFRKGTAPLTIVERKYQKNADQDVASNLAKQYIFDAINDKGLKPISEPVYHYDTIKRDESFSFKATFEIFPTVEMGKYKLIPANERSCTITDENVDKEIEVLRENYARVEKKDAESSVQNGDLINFKLKRVDNTDKNDWDKTAYKDYSIVVGKSKEKFTIDRDIIGMKEGEEREVEINYPRDYSISELAGQKVKYLIKISEINSFILPELNDDLAKKLNYESLTDMKLKIKDFLVKFVEDKTINEVKSEIIKDIVDNSKFDIPESMIRSEMNHLYQKTCTRINFSGNIDKFEETYGIKPGEFKEKIRKEAVQSIKSTIILSEIAKKEDIKVTEEKIKEAIVKIAEKSNSTLEKIEELLLQNDSKSDLENDLKFEAALDFLYQNGKIKKLKPVPLEELIKEKVT